MNPIVAIVGRPNVGKSTLFNRILGKHRAIVHDEPGVTRDLNYADVKELGRSFTLVDTGGFDLKEKEIIASQIRDQARLAIEEADLIILLMDGRLGPASDDRELVMMLRKAGKPVIYAANKIDTKGQEAGLADFYSIGADTVLPVSAEHGRGVNELIDGILKRLPAAEEVSATAEERTKVAVVGRPNVGKSSILNKLIGRPRAIVSDLAGTTRDPVDTLFTSDGKSYLFIDTAGIRKKNRISMTVESYCVMEAIKAIGRSDCVLLVLDAGTGVTAQDEKIAGIIEGRKKCSVIVVNKWDTLADKDTHTVEYVTDKIKQELTFISYSPVVFTSAKTGQRIKKIFETVEEVMQNSRRRVKTSELNTVFERMVLRHRPSAYRGKEVKFYYITQTDVLPPTFVIFTNNPKGVEEPYKRYIINSLREELGLNNVPLKVFYRGKK